MKRGLIDRDITPTDRLAERVAEAVEVEVGGPGDEDALVEALRGKDVVFATSRLPISREVLERTDLELVAKIGTGVDNVDLDAAREFGIPVTYTPGSNAIAVAEHTVGLLLAVRRQFEAGRRVLRAGGWRDDLSMGSLLYGKTVGIVGFGDIGSRVGSLLAGFHPELLAHDPYVESIDVEYAGATLVGLDDLLERSDAVAVNAELTAETHGMIGEREFDLMKEDAILVNTARGPIVREDALVEALRAGEIAGAGLDVFEEEPPSPDSPLYDFENVVTTPHSAGVTTETRERAIDLLAENVLALLAGETIPDRHLATTEDKWSRV